MLQKQRWSAIRFQLTCCKISTVTFVAGIVPGLFCCPAFGINSVFIWAPDVHWISRGYEVFSGMQNEVLRVLIAEKLQKWMCHLKWAETLKILSHCATSSSVWIVTLALKTCTFLARLCLAKQSLKNKTAFGSTEKIHSQQGKKQKTNKQKRNTQGKGRHLRNAAAFLFAISELHKCAHCTPAAPVSAALKGLFYFWVLLGQRMILLPCKWEIFWFVCFGLAL